ncbi:hypothetical protein [Aequorivita antarctica]|uniref:Uncharacterized protein n=1 Tax=Aequorivita antarctica TaxID=153266 RepID=A0A5C6Z3H8_9FLAO|nr:hypothetical protein [Aequorivita antarctica]TXD74735.1 hypothetical protein ESU54_00655 [Aequorivita antarctica]
MENTFKSQATSRIEYAMRYNTKIKKQNCDNCNKNIEIPLNKIYAKESKLTYLSAGIIFLIGSVLVLIFWIKILSSSNTAMGLYAVALILLVPVWVYVIIKKQDRIRVSTFNHTYVSEDL